MSCAVEQKVADAIARYHLLDDGESVIVALSGGADSVALLNILHSLGYNCVAAHCNFHLRGQESMRDETHARKSAQALGCRFEKTDFNVAEYQSLHPDSISTEMACRQLRYDWFETLRTRLGIRSIAVGHNADDNAETLILNLLRSSSLAGIRGMRHRNSASVIRPMLGISRREITEYLKENGIEAVTDSSNLTDDYTRNRIRHHVIPALQLAAGSSKNVLKCMTESLQHLSENHDFYCQAVAEKQKLYTLSDGTVDLRTLSAKEPHAALLLYEWLSPQGFNRNQTDAMLESAATSGRRFISSTGVQMVSSRGCLSRTDCPDAPSSPETVFEISTIGRHDFNPERDASVAYFDAESLEKSDHRLQIRYWREGDRLAPFGMKGTRLVSDIFNDAKLTANQKKRLPLLTLGDETILWVPGLRASRHFPVTSTTERILKFTYNSDLNPS